MHIKVENLDSYSLKSLRALACTPLECLHSCSKVCLKAFWKWLTCRIKSKCLCIKHNAFPDLMQARCLISHPYPSTPHSLYQPEKAELCILVVSSLSRRTCVKRTSFLYYDLTPSLLLFLDTTGESLVLIPASCPWLSLVMGTLLAVWIN